MPATNIEPTASDYVDANRKLWNEWTGLHLHSDHYDLDGLRAGTAVRIGQSHG